MKKALLVSILICTITSICFCQNPWPAEPWSEAINLTSLYKRFSNDLSGAHWNPVRRELWLTMNGSGTVAKLKEDGNGGFELAEAWRPEGDLEGITQAEYDEETFLVIDEGKGRIKEYDVSSPGKINLIHNWKISQHLPKYNGDHGPEGIVFIPDEWLERNGFKDEEDSLYTSQGGMGGLIFIAHQKSGFLYVFDLSRIDDTYKFIGSYATNHDESAGLEFDRSNGCLYILHNQHDNYIEMTNLTSSINEGVRKFTLLNEFNAPKGNVEGIAVTPEDTGEDWCWLTLDDGNRDALRWFQKFNPFGINSAISHNNLDKGNLPLVYPNPTTGILNIEFNKLYDELKVQVTNNKGQKISQFSFNSIKRISMEIASPPGIYFIIFSTPEGTSLVRKVIKM